MQHFILKNQIKALAELQYEFRDLVLDADKGVSEHLVYSLANVLSKSYDQNMIRFSLKYPVENRDMILKLEQKYGASL